jgi:hypothetical protein
MDRYMREHYKSNASFRGQGVPSFCAHVKTLLPDATMAPDDYGHIQIEVHKELEKARQRPDSSWESAIEAAADFKIISNGGGGIEFTDLDWSYIDKWLQGYKQFHTFADIVSNLRILGHEVSLTKTDWSKFQDILKAYRADQNGAIGLAKMAAAMSILAADGIEITDKGLQIRKVGREESNEKIKPIPEAAHL